MIYMKKFKVAESKADGSTLRYLLLAADGECWLIVVDNEDEAGRWHVGVMVEVPICVVNQARGDRCVMPDWSTFGVESSVLFELQFAEQTVAEHWGKDMAERHFPA